MIILSKKEDFKKLYNRVKILADKLDIFANLKYKEFLLVQILVKKISNYNFKFHILFF